MHAFSYPHRVSLNLNNFSTSGVGQAITDGQAKIVNGKIAAEDNLHISFFQCTQTGEEVRGDLRGMCGIAK